LRFADALGQVGGHQLVALAQHHGALDGVLQLARSTPSRAYLRSSWGRAKIRVSAITPGLTETEGARSLAVVGSDFAPQKIADTPFRRMG
jgi:NAD(P)-dependent dehydrogenase (short-subunit alcohol dehydrogenase family)